jgi:hypothetical protein
MLQTKMRIIYNYLKNKLKIQLHNLRVWINVSRFILAITMLTIGYTGNFIQEHKADFLIVKTIRIEIASANSTSPSMSVSADVAAGEEQVFDKSAGEIASALSPYDIIKKYFPGEEKLAYAIMMCESSGEADRIGDTHMKKYSYGLFQINQTWHELSEKELLDPETNVRYAKELRDKSGWSQWSCFKNGGFNKFL